MTALMGPDGGGGSLEDQITLVLVKKGVISCENETQCDDNKQVSFMTVAIFQLTLNLNSVPEARGRYVTLSKSLRKRRDHPVSKMFFSICLTDGWKIRCTVPFSECITEEHKPDCFCKEDFLGNGTESCVPKGFNVEANKVKIFLVWMLKSIECNPLARLQVLERVLYGVGECYNQVPEPWREIACSRHQGDYRYCEILFEQGGSWRASGSWGMGSEQPKGLART